MLIPRAIKKGVALGLWGIGFFLFAVSAAEAFELFDHTPEYSDKAIEATFSTPVIIDPHPSRQLSDLKQFPKTLLGFIGIPVLSYFQTSHLESYLPALLDSSPPKAKPLLFQFFSILRL